MRNFGAVIHLSKTSGEGRISTFGPPNSTKHKLSPCQHSWREPFCDIRVAATNEVGLRERDCDCDCFFHYRPVSKTGIQSGGGLRRLTPLPRHQSFAHAPSFRVQTMLLTLFSRHIQALATDRALQFLFIYLTPLHPIASIPFPVARHASDSQS